jgi:CHAT domain-containing protein
MACSPQDLPELQVDLEQQRLEASMNRLSKANMVKIDWLAENSLAALQRAVDTGAYHIFHFVGHGDFVEEQGRKKGVLLFEDQAGAAQEVTGERLAWILRRSVRLAVINACEGARSQAGDPSTGVASNLLLQGIPAVVAMQFAVSDSVAVQFARDFYGGLAIGLPVDAAINSARRGVLATFANSVEWATPVLF